MKRIIFLALVLFVLFSGFVSANSINIEKVYVNGIDVSQYKPQIELGSKMQILVFLDGDENVDDVKLRAWIGGYEYESIEDFSEMFDIDNGVMYKKYLYLEIPEDLNVGDNDYKLYVEAYTGSDSEMQSYTLYVEEPRHGVDIKEIILSSTDVRVGDDLGVKVRIENLGGDSEEDLRVVATLEGVSAVSYVEELGSKGSDVDNEVSSQTMVLKVPNVNGDYLLNVRVEYDNGHSIVEESRYVRIGNGNAFDDEAVASVANVNDLIVNEEKTFKVLVTNLGLESKEFNLFVSGIDSVDCSDSIVVGAGKVGELYFTINPREVGFDEIDVQVSSDEGLVLEKTFNVEVTEKSYLRMILLAGFFALLAGIGILIYKKSL